MPDEPLRDFLTHNVTEAHGEPLEAAPALALGHRSVNAWASFARGNPACFMIPFACSAATFINFSERWSVLTSMSERVRGRLFPSPLRLPGITGD